MMQGTFAQPRRRSSGNRHRPRCHPIRVVHYHRRCRRNPMEEEWMSRLPYRGLIALTAVVVVLLSSRPAGAQVVGVPSPPRQHGGLLSDLVTGAWYDRTNQVLAERHLPWRQEKLNRDAARGNSVAVNRDVRRIDNLQYRIAVDEWLIRKNSCQELGYYPYPLRLDPITYCAIAQYRPPPRPPGRW